MLWRELRSGETVVTLREVKLFREGGNISAEPGMRRRQRYEGLGKRAPGTGKALPWVLTEHRLESENLLQNTVLLPGIPVTSLCRPPLP